MINFLILLILLSAILPMVIGLFTLYHLLRGKQLPADKSNRINHIRLWWFVLTRENLFTNTFEWMKNDELDNVNKK